MARYDIRYEDVHHSEVEVMCNFLFCFSHALASVFHSFSAIVLFLFLFDFLLPFITTARRAFDDGGSEIHTHESAI